MAKKIRVTSHDALIIVDIEKSFCPGGSLGVSEGDLIVPVINALTRKFRWRFATKDWHPKDHSSFAEFGGDWPPHCVEGTEGAEFHSNFSRDFVDRIFYKGFDRGKDEYSGFGAVSARGISSATELSARQLMHGLVHDAVDFLADALHAERVVRIFVVGLATDYCVKATALDGIRYGFEVWLVTDAIAAVNIDPDDGEKAITEMKEAGVRLIKSDKIERLT